MNRPSDARPPAAGPAPRSAAGTASGRACGPAPGPAGAAAPARVALAWRTLAGPVWRTLPWAALAAGGVLGLLLVAVPALLPVPDPGPAVWAHLLRGAAVAAGLGMCFLLDDPARHTTAAVPVPRPARHLLRVALLVPPAAVWWLAVAVIARLGAGPLPLGGLTVEAAALLALPVAVSAGVVRLSGRTAPSPAAVPALLGALVGAAFLPDRWALLVPPGDDGWARAHQSWAALAVAAVAAVLALGAEPTRRGPVRFRRTGQRACR